MSILAEMESAATAVRQNHLDRLRFLGVSIGAIADMGVKFFPFGVARCEPIGGGFYQPLPDGGKVHVIVPVRDDGVLVDLCAFRSDNPGGWMLRTGNGWALGLEEGLGRWLWFKRADLTAKPPRQQVGAPAHIYSDPLDWLRGGSDGICVLDWSAPDVRFLDVLPEVTCSDAATAALLRGALTRPARIPTIRLMELSNVA